VPQLEIILGLLVAVAALATLAMRLRIPYPILLVVGGSLLGFVPGLPRVELDPDLVFILFLPPLLYASAVFTSWRDFRANVRTISLLAVGLVLMTTFVVAAVVHFVIGLPWAASLVLGAVVSPTDAIAATAIARRLGVPRRIVTILEGESLVNDATGIVVYRIAVAAVVTGAFSAWEAGLQFVVGAAGGIAFGFLIGWVVVWTRRHLADEPSIQTTVSLLTPFVAYLVAEELPPYVWHGLGLPGELHLSGVLAVVVTGLYLGRRGPYILSSPMRLQGFAVAELLTFLLNGLIFILIGLQLRNVVGGLSRFTVGELIAYAVLVSLTVVLVRMLWVFLATYVPRWVSRQLRERGPRSPGAA
jgi:monovalent cation/hydrogen antiporter